MRRICNSDEVFDTRLKELKSHFVKRAFRKNMIENQFEKAKAKRRENLLYPDKNRDKQVKRMSLVVNFHPTLSGIGKIIESLWPILHVLEGMKKVFERKIMVAYGKLRNIKDEIVRSKVKRVNNDNKGMRKCGKSRCQICNYVKEGCAFNEDNGSSILIFLFIVIRKE